MRGKTCHRRGNPISAACSPPPLRSAQVWRAFCHASAHCRTPVRTCLSRRHHAKYSEGATVCRHTREIFSHRRNGFDHRAYLDLSGTERLHGPPLPPPTNLLHGPSRAPRTSLLRRLATTRLVAKVASDQAKPRASVGPRRAAKHAFLRRYPSAKFRHRRSDRTRIARAQHETVEQLAAQPLENLKKFRQWAPRYTAKRAAEIPQFIIDRSLNPFRTITLSAKTPRTPLHSRHAQPSLAKKPASACVKQASPRAPSLSPSVTPASYLHARENAREPRNLTPDIFAASESFSPASDHRRKIRLLA